MVLPEKTDVTYVRPYSDVTYVRSYRLSGWRWGGRAAYGDGSVRAIFLGGKSCGSVALATRVFLAGNLTNRKWFSVVCTLIDNDIRHHSGQNVVDSRGAAENLDVISFLRFLLQNCTKACQTAVFTKSCIFRLRRTFCTIFQ